MCVNVCGRGVQREYDYDVVYVHNSYGDFKIFPLGKVIEILADSTPTLNAFCNKYTHFE